jgi:hypothetical protein
MSVKSDSMASYNYPQNPANLSSAMMNNIYGMEQPSDYPTNSNDDRLTPPSERINDTRVSLCI